MDDLQYVLEVARAGSLAKAGRNLGVTHSTVLRRVAALEESHGVRLFDRLPGGYALTPSGEEMLASAQEIADTVIELERRLLGRDLRLEGVLRVTTTDTLMASLLPPILATFQRSHPGIILDLSVSSSLVDLARRQADVAIRASSAPEDTLVGRRIAKIAFAAYGRHSGVGADEAQWRWVGPGDALVGSVAARWLSGQKNNPNVVFRADTMVGMAEAAAAGIGVAPLPCYLGDRWPGLQRVRALSDMPLNELWILTHADLSRTPRVRAFTSFVAVALAAQREAIEDSRSASL